jgi:hypothetical protein
MRRRCVWRVGVRLLRAVQWPQGLSDDADAAADRPVDGDARAGRGRHHGKFLFCLDTVECQVETPHWSQRKLTARRPGCWAEWDVGEKSQILPRSLASEEASCLAGAIIPAVRH